MNEIEIKEKLDGLERRKQIWLCFKTLVKLLKIEVKENPSSVLGSAIVSLELFSSQITYHFRMTGFLNPDK